MESGSSQRADLGSATKKTTVLGLNVPLTEELGREIAQHGLTSRSKACAHPRSRESNHDMSTSKAYVARIQLPDFHHSDVSYYLYTTGDPFARALRWRMSIKSQEFHPHTQVADEVDYSVER